MQKCFAGREKDVGHARALLRRRPDLGIVERRIEELLARGVQGAADAADFLDGVVSGAGTEAWPAPERQLPQRRG